MIAIDSSAIIAILEEEPEQNAIAQAISSADAALVSAVSVYECGLVMYGRRRQLGLDHLWNLLGFIQAEIIPFDETQARAALDGFRAYGKGVSPVARLNMGDCASYALAKTYGVPLLYKGNDFAATDVVSCI